MSRVIIAAVNDWETNLAYCANSMFNLTDDFLYCYGNLWTLYVRGKMDSGAVVPSGHNSSLIKTGRKKKQLYESACVLLSAYSTSAKRRVTVACVWGWGCIRQTFYIKNKLGSNSCFCS